MSALPQPIFSLPLPKYETRLLRIGERIPADLNLGLLRLDPKWIWVVSGPAGIESALAIAPGHGIAILLRLVSLPLAPRHHLIRLFRKALADVHARGYNSYMVCLDIDRSIEAKLARIAIKAGALAVAKNVYVIGGPTKIGY